MRFKNLSQGTVYIGNGMGVTILTGYALEQNREYPLHLPLGDDTKQAYYAVAAAGTSVIFVAEQCCSACYNCPKVRGV